MARKSYIAKAPIRRLMLEEGAELVQEDALLYLIELLNKKATSLTKNANELVQADKRTKVTAEDIKNASRL